MLPIVIGITGLAHSGKDTSADYIISALKDRYHVDKFGLADQLKVICQHLIKLFYNIEIPIGDFYDIQKKEQVREDLPKFTGQPFKIRTILQMVGTEIFRDLISEEVWCQYLKEHYIQQDRQDQVVVISDIRMLNEVQYFRQMETSGELSRFICLRVRRERRDGLTGGNAQHKTETGIDTLPVDYEINNNGTYEELHCQINAIISGL
jgi:dephospho-CoA kinase